MSRNDEREYEVSVTKIDYVGTSAVCEADSPEQAAMDFVRDMDKGSYIVYVTVVDVKTGETVWEDEV